MIISARKEVTQVNSVQLNINFIIAMLISMFVLQTLIKSIFNFLEKTQDQEVFLKFKFKFEFPYIVFDFSVKKRVS
jgi:Kef-type K+ transport system membrane component KefB